MASNERSSICCAFANDDHFIEKPIELSCGHLICQKCIPKENNEDLACQICGEKNEVDLNKAKKSYFSLQLGNIFKKVKYFIPTKALLSLNFTGMLEDLHRDYKESFKSLKSN